MPKEVMYITEAKAKTNRAIFPNWSSDKAVLAKELNTNAGANI